MHKTTKELHLKKKNCILSKEILVLHLLSFFQFGILFMYKKRQLTRSLLVRTPWSSQKLIKMHLSIPNTTKQTSVNLIS